MKKRSILEIVGGCAIFSAIMGGILNCFILPIGYIITHDCGKWICNHSYPMTWESYAIVTGIVFILLFLIAFISEKATEEKTTPTHSRSNQTYYRRNNQTSYRGSNRAYSRETDYYNSNMEGAPGYNGFD